MGAPTNLYQYYTGQGQSLPSVAQNAKTFESYGLGSASGYTGSASQNQALLGKLMGGGSPSAAPTGGYTSGGSQPAGGGYSASAPSGDPLLTNDVSSLNSSEGDLQSLAAKQAADLNSFTGGQADTISSAYKTAMGQTGLQGYQDTVNKLQNTLAGSQTGAAAVVPETIAAARGSFANNDQVQTQGNTNSIPYAEQVAQISANLTPAETAEATAAQNTSQIAGNIVSGAQLREQGFTAGQQQQLQALQSKIDMGQQMTNDEYQSYTALKSAETSAAAQVQSAQIGAGATTSAANIAAAASMKNTEATNALGKYLGQLSNPYVKVGADGVGVPDFGTAGSPAAPPANAAALNQNLGKYFPATAGAGR
jgi:hypothetical protein